MCVCVYLCVSLLTLTAPYESNSNFRESVIQTQLAARDYQTLQLTVNTVSALQLSIQRTLINHRVLYNCFHCAVIFYLTYLNILRYNYQLKIMCN